MDITQFAHGYLEGLKDVLASFDYETYEQIIQKLLSAYDNEKQIFVMGNGGSGATASHFACDINKGCCFDLEKKFKMICLNDNIPTMLALANDVSYDVVFVEQMKNFFNPGDLAIGISGSGNSENVLRAMRYANEKGGQTIGLCGFSGGKLAPAVDVGFVAPVNDMQKVEDVHIIVVHMIMQTVYTILNNNH
jgi:D-sedoheptulose 7-phosphate isomerase